MVGLFQRIFILVTAVVVANDTALFIGLQRFYLNDIYPTILFVIPTAGAPTLIYVLQAFYLNLLSPAVSLVIPAMIITILPIGLALVIYPRRYGRK
jgi:hypothetical protein